MKLQPDLSSNDVSVVCYQHLFRGKKIGRIILTNPFLGETWLTLFKIHLNTLSTELFESTLVRRHGDGCSRTQTHLRCTQSNAVKLFTVLKIPCICTLVSNKNTFYKEVFGRKLPWWPKDKETPMYVRQLEFFVTSCWNMSRTGIVTHGHHTRKNCHWSPDLGGISPLTAMLHLHLNARMVEFKTLSFWILVSQILGKNWVSSGYLQTMSEFHVGVIHRSASLVLKGCSVRRSFWLQKVAPLSYRLICSTQTVYLFIPVQTVVSTR